MDPWVREEETGDKLRVTEALPFRQSRQPSQALQIPITPPACLWVPPGPEDGALSPASPRAPDPLAREHPRQGASSLRECRPHTLPSKPSATGQGEASAVHTGAQNLAGLAPDWAWETRHGEATGGRAGARAQGAHSCLS